MLEEQTNDVPAASPAAGLEGVDAAAGASPASSAANYEPLPESRRSGTAICLSGGGFRSALFHLGALRRLNELGVLSKIDAVTSVSGGSIIAAHLAAHVQPWPDSGSFDGWEERVAVPFRDFAHRDLRTAPILHGLLPWHWLDSSAAVESLEQHYEQELTGLRLRMLPERPRFIFCATDLAFGVSWTFTRDEVGDYQAGYAQTPEDWSVAKAVAASSCFPPAFNPLPVHLSPEQLAGGRAQDNPDRNSLIAGLRLSDGGVYDNMGMEPVWKTSKCVLVSDGGSPFDFEADGGLFQRLARYYSIVGNQARAIRKRWLIASYQAKSLQGAYWGIGSRVASYSARPAEGYSSELVGGAISRVRTDLNPFSDGEIAVLENHGYTLADAAIRTHAPELMDGDARPFRVPHPDWMDEERARRALGG